MFLSLGLILIVGVVISILFKKIRIPSLIGFMCLGIILNQFGLIDSSLLSISSEIRRIALIVILLKAGLSLDIRNLRKVGRPAIMMCFIPATLEMIGFIVFGPLVLGISYLESFLIGSVLAAVSPAVVIPRMGEYMEKGIGTNKGIPEMITAGSSLDDVYCIVIFSCLSSLLSGEDSNMLVNAIKIPSSIILGIAVGLGIGFLYAFLFDRFHVRDSIKVVVLLGTSFLLTALDMFLEQYLIRMSSLLSVIAMGLVIFNKNHSRGKRLMDKFNKIWIVAEILLFVMLGSSIRLDSVSYIALRGLLIIAIGLLFRMVGTALCLIGTNLSIRERLFVLFSETPKATVQAAIGGSLIGAVGIDQSFAYLLLSISALSILLLAPLGAILMDSTSGRLLKKE